MEATLGALSVRPSLKDFPITTTTRLNEHAEGGWLGTKTGCGHTWAWSPRFKIDINTLVRGHTLTYRALLKGGPQVW